MSQSRLIQADIVSEFEVLKQRLRNDLDNPNYKEDDAFRDGAFSGLELYATYNEAFWALACYHDSMDPEQCWEWNGLEAKRYDKDLFLQYCSILGA